MIDYETDEVRRSRRAISVEHGNNLDALVDYYQQLEAQLRTEGKVTFEEPKEELQKARK